MKKIIFVFAMVISSASYAEKIHQFSSLEECVELEFEVMRRNPSLMGIGYNHRGFGYHYKGNVLQFNCGMNRAVGGWNLSSRTVPTNPAHAKAYIYTTEEWKAQVQMRERADRDSAQRRQQDFENKMSVLTR